MEKIQYVLDNITRDDTAEYMAELLMDNDNTTYKMFEALAAEFIEASEEKRKGINTACVLLTGWYLETIAQQIMERYANKGDE